MTKAHILKNFFKKYFNYDASGNSPIQVLSDVMENVDDLGGGGDGGEFEIVFTRSWSDKGGDYVLTCNKTKEEIADYTRENGPLHMVAQYVDYYIEGDVTTKLGRCDNVSIMFYDNGNFQECYTRFIQDNSIPQNELWFVDLVMDDTGAITETAKSFTLTPLT